MLHTSLTVLSLRGQSCMPSALVRSIKSLSPSMTMLRYLIHHCLKTHLDGCRKYDSLSRRVRTMFTILRWHGVSSLVAMRMLSM